MSEKQAKLMRYFLKAGGNPNLVKVTRALWRGIPAKNRGKISRYMREWCAMDQAKRQLQTRRNSAVLAGFAAP